MGFFWKLSVTNFLAKKPKHLLTFWAILKTSIKDCCGNYFGSSFTNGLPYSIIWTHCFPYSTASKLFEVFDKQTFFSPFQNQPMRLLQVTRPTIKSLHYFHRNPSFRNCGQSYKASTLVNYDSSVLSISNLQVITSLES